MGVYAGPDVSESGLVLALDGGNLKSFRGVNATNLITAINYGQTNQNGALYKVTNGSESVYIPSLGYVTSLYVDFYNDYNGGSGICCPNLYNYGGMAVSPSTTYTYSIIYKTSTGYSHPNYMYRYEYAPAGYVTEAGVHSTNNRTSLGDGWWFAWGQFTTSATTTTLSTYLFHYEYATQNRVYVYRAAIYQGTYVIPPEHMLTSGQVRGTTVATGGGCIDLSDKGNNGSLVNGVSYTSSNGGSLVFDGTNQYISVGAASKYFTAGELSFTFEAWIKTPGLGVNRTANGIFSFSYGNLLYLSSNGFLTFGVYNAANNSWGYLDNDNVNLHDNVWHHVAGVMSVNTGYIYVDGVQKKSSSGVSWTGTNVWSGMDAVIGNNQNDVYYYFNGNIAMAKFYKNKGLTASEIQQNFNASRGRFGR